MRLFGLALASNAIFQLDAQQPAFPPPPSSLTEYQRAMLAASVPIAQENSKAAEAVLIEVFGSKAYKDEVNRLSDARLAALSPQESLAELKRAVSSVEYATSFGLSAAGRIKQPGMSSPNYTTIDQWGGVYPNQWQLKYYNSTLVGGLDHNQWSIYDGGEVSLYNLKPFADPASLTPSWEETTERPTYVTVNNRRQELGNEPFGEYGMVYRGSVLKERAMIISGDSGEFENGCNTSIHTTRKWWWPVVEHLFYKCSEMGDGYDKPGFHPPAARLGAELHTVVRDAAMFFQSLPRYLGQIMSSNADVVPLESFFYTEAVILGSVRMRDVKFIFAGFDLFGTYEGDQLIAFAKKYQMPITWAVGFQLGVGKWYNLLPTPLGRPTMPAGRARLLDISTVSFTDGKSPTAEAQAIWKSVDKDVRAFRASGNAVTSDQVAAWFKQLSAADTLVFPLRSDRCPVDLCIGTDSADACVCRNDPDATALLI